MKKPIEAWPFLEEESNHLIYPDGYYGISDACITGPDRGYATKEEAIAAILAMNLWGVQNISTKPTDIGEASMVVCTGKQFIRQMRALTEGDLSEIGKFVG